MSRYRHRDAPAHLRAAEERLNAALALVAGDSVAPRLVGLFAQQATAEALKAVLDDEDVEYAAATDDIAGLIWRCRQTSIPFWPGDAEFERLTPYAVAERYGLPDPKTVDPELACAWAEVIVRWARRWIKPSTERWVREFVKEYPDFANVVVETWAGERVEVTVKGGLIVPRDAGAGSEPIPPARVCSIVLKRGPLGGPE